MRRSGALALVAMLAVESIAAQQPVPAPRAPQGAPQRARVAAAAAKPSYDSLIATIVSLIQASKIDEAAPKALEAVALEPDRYDGHLYLGIIRFRQHALADAEVSLRKALSLAPADRKPKVHDALDLVVNTQQFSGLMATAENADREGAKAKAARSYAAAWWLFNDRTDVAAKALQGLITTNGQFEAARIWNSLTKTQKDQNAALFRGISINASEVTSENDRRRPSLQDAIRADRFAQAIDLATPMAQADPAAYAPVVGTLLFLNNDRVALRWSSALKPEQLVRMDLFSEAQMNQMVHGALFRSYLEDVVGGNPDRIVEGLRAPIEKPGIQRRALEQFQQAFASAKSLPDTAARLRTLQELRERYPDHTAEIAPEVGSTAKLEAARLYHAIGALLASVGDAQLMKGGSVKYTDIAVEPCRTVRFESTVFMPSDWSKESYFRWSSSVRIDSDADEDRPQYYFSVGTDNPHNTTNGGDNPALHVNGSNSHSVSVDEEHQNYQLSKGKDLGWTQNYRHAYYTFLFDPRTPAMPARLRDLFEAARKACKLD